MSVGRHILSIAILLLIIGIFFPGSEAIATCSIQSSCSGTDVAVASVASINGGHAGPVGEFSDVLCCEAAFEDPFFGYNDAFSISVIDGNQGHVSVANEFGLDIESSYSGCLISTRSEISSNDEVCVAGVQNSGTLPNGNPQGHITNCGNGSHNIICCPLGYSRDTPTSCDENFRDFLIRGISGDSPIPPSTDTVYDVEIDWTGIQGIEGTIYSTPKGSPGPILQSFTFTDGDYAGFKNFSETFNFTTVGEYTIHAEGQKQDGTQPDAYSIDINVSNTHCVNNARIIEGTNFDACALTTADLPPMPPNVTWTTATSYTCANTSKTCYTGMCTPPFTFNTTTRTCDGPGVGSPMTPQVQLEANPDNGSAPLNVTFTVNITDDTSPIDYIIEYGDGFDSGTIPALAATVNTVEYYTYPGVGLYTATLTATDADGNMNTSTAVINVTNNAPIIDLSATPTVATTPYNSTITVNVTDDSPNVTINLTHAGTGFFKQFNFTQPFTPRSVNFSVSNPQIYVINATAEDTYGGTSKDNITLQGDNLAPFVTVTANPSQLPAPNSTTINVTVSDDSKVVRVRLYNGTTQIGSQMVFNSYPGNDSRIFTFSYPGLYTMKRMIFMQDHYSSEYKTLFTV